MNCTHVQQRLDDLVDGQLSLIEQEAVQVHMLDCQDCRARLAETQHLLLDLRDIPVPEPLAGYQQRMLGFLRKRTSANKRPSRNWFIAGFASAALVMLMVWGLLVTPANLQGITPSVVTIQLIPQQLQSIDLVFNSPIHIKQASMRLQLPAHIELSGYKNQQLLEWQTELRPGSNRLTLPIIAKRSGDGVIHASISHAGKTRGFVIKVQSKAASSRRHSDRQFSLSIFGVKSDKV